MNALKSVALGWSQFEQPAIVVTVIPKFYESRILFGKFETFFTELILFTELS